MKYVKWALLALLAATALASQPVYNYFPPPGITYSTANGMTLGTPAGGAFGPGTLNTQGVYVNGVPVGSSTGTVTSVSVVSANGLSGTVATPTTAAAITLAPTFTGIGYSTGFAFQTAVAANFPTLNQSTTGNAATSTLATAASALSPTPTLCGSGQAAQGILANGNATGCITPFSVVNEPANTLFAGPASGTPALPSFRAMVAADLPLSSSPTWTGSTTMTPASGVGLAIDGNASNDALHVTNGAGQYSRIIGSPTTGTSDGLVITSGSNSSDTAFVIQNSAQTRFFFQVSGDGSTKVWDSAGGGPFQIGYLGTPYNEPPGSYTVTLSDRGKTVKAGAAGITFSLPCSGTFTSGDVVTLLYSQGGTATVTASTGTLYWAIGGGGVTGNRTLNSISIATVIFDGNPGSLSTACLITGSGIT